MIPFGNRMKNTNTIAAAKEKFARQIEANNAVISERKAHNRAIEVKLRLLEEIESENGPTEAKAGNAATISQAKKYAKTGLSEAAFDAVHRLYEKQADGRIGRGTVARYMIDNGYVPKGKNFSISVDVALRRLAMSGKIDTYLKDNKRGYRPLEIMS